MKFRYVKSTMSVNRGHTAAVALSLGLLFCLELKQVDAQLQVQKRITSVWTATDAEGSRVTVASDAQLNNYEAYTRGNRFYVKIPSADLPAKTGSLLGRGFDDVQIQKAGDGMMLSFRLQPGTTAHVNQKLNRLEVVFSIPTRSPATGIERNDLSEMRRIAAQGSVTAGNKQNPARDERGISSSTNPTSAGSPRPLSATETQSPAIASGKKGSTAENSQAPPNPLTSSSPLASPSSFVSTSSSPTGTTSAGTQSPQNLPSANGTSVSAPGGRSDWSSSLRELKTRVRLNPGLSAAAAVAFLGLLRLVFARRKRRLAEMPLAPTAKGDISPVAGTIAAQGRVEVSSKSFGSSPVVNQVAHPREDPEREVFEL